jgi:hypothetical protein
MPLCTGFNLRVGCVGHGSGWLLGWLVARVGPVLASLGEMGEGSEAGLASLVGLLAGKDKRRQARTEPADSREYGPKLVLIIKSLSSFCKHFSKLKTILNSKQI